MRSLYSKPASSEPTISRSAMSGVLLQDIENRAGDQCERDRTGVGGAEAPVAVGTGSTEPGGELGGRLSGGLCGVGGCLPGVEQGIALGEPVAERVGERHDRV